VSRLPHKTDAFTLVELLTCTVLIGVLSTLAFQVLDLGFTFCRESEAGVEGWREARQVVQLLQQELRQMPAQRQHVEFQGSRFSIVYATSLGPKRTEGPEATTRLRRCEYGMTPAADGVATVLYRRVRDTHGQLLETTIFQRIRGIAFAYVGREATPGDRWQDAWDARADGLPLGVRVDIQFSEGTRQRRTRSLSFTTTLPTAMSL